MLGLKLAATARNRPFSVPAEWKMVLHLVTQMHPTRTACTTNFTATFRAARLHEFMSATKQRYTSRQANLPLSHVSQMSPTRTACVVQLIAIQQSDMLS